MCGQGEHSSDFIFVLSCTVKLNVCPLHISLGNERGILSNSNLKCIMNGSKTTKT